jgi:hypothetical protein
MRSISRSYDLARFLAEEAAEHEGLAHAIYNFGRDFAVAPYSEIPLAGGTHEELICHVAWHEEGS